MPEIPEVPPGLSENLVEVEGDLFRVVKDGRRKHLVPVRVRANLNPLNVAAAVIAAAGGLLAANIAWHGVSFAVPGTQFTVFKGLKETSFGKDIAGWYENRGRLQDAKDAAKIREDLTCGEIDSLIVQAERDGDVAVALFWRKEKQRKGCP